MKRYFIVFVLIALAFSLVFAESESQANLQARQAIKAMLGPAPVSAAGHPTGKALTNLSEGVNGPAYGVDAAADAWIRFALNAPSNTSQNGTTTGSLYAGDFGPMGVFYAIDNDASNLVTIDTANATITIVGAVTPQAGHTWTGLTWDAVNGVMYGLSTDGTASALYTIDPATGATTLVGTTTDAALAIDLSADPLTGQLWVHDLGDNIYTMDPTTAAVTLVGPTGFDANYAQGMDFNPETGELYLAAYNNTLGAAELRKVDLATGNTTLIGPIGAGAGVEVCAFGIVGKAGDDLDPKAPTDFKAYSDYTTPTSMLLTWTDPTEYNNGTPLTNFTIEVMRDGSHIASVPMGTQTYTDAGLVDGQLYTYEIYAKDNVDSTSTTVSASWTAGGAAKPMPPTSFAVVDLGGGQLEAQWVNPSKNIDGTPMDDLAGINLYEDGSLLMSITVASGDTGQAAAQAFTPSAGTHQYYVTAVDNETPANESDPSNVSYSPLALPFFDDFATAGVPNPGFWLNDDAEVSDLCVNPPSAPYALALDGFPHSAPEVGDVVTLLPVDLSAQAGAGIVLSYWYQPQGNGNAPEASDSLVVDFLNDQGTWVTVKSYPGTALQPFANEVISLDAVNPGTGATFFHAGFQIRFRNYATVSTTSNFDHWFIDDVFLGVPNNDPIMTVSPTTLADTLLVGATDVLHFTIANDQPMPSTLNFTVTESPAVDWLSVNPASGTVTSSQQQVVDVNIDASVVSAGTYTTQLIVDGNDPNNPQVTIDVTLVANETPVIGITPDSLHFDLLTNEVDSATFTISNTGNGPLEIVGIEDEEVSVEDWVPAFVQPQAPKVFEAKGENGAYRGEVTDGSGGPDPFGYKWIDSDEQGGPVYNFVDISSTGTVVNLQPTGTFDPKDEGQATITLPWDVKFYGQNYSELQVNSNGFVTFDMSFFANAYTNAGIPTSDAPNGIVAPFWDDLDGSVNNGDIYYEQIGNKFIIQWTNWSHYAGSENLIFQVIFYQNSATINFVYADMTGAQTDATVGIEDMTGTVGLQIAYDQAYAHSQLLTKISKGAEWLSENPVTGIIPPGGTLDVTLKADATGMLGGNYLANVVVASNDPANPVVKLPKVSLTVTGQPDIQVTPKPLVFDTAMVGQAPVKELLVENVGSDQLNITNITVNNSVFTLDTTNFTLAPFSSQVVNVKFEPLVPGTYEGWIVVESNDPDTPMDSTMVKAVAIEAPVAVVNPNYTNPVQIQLGDSMDISVNVGNAGGSDLVWDAVLSMNPGSMVSYPVTFGMLPASENAEVTPHVSHSGGNNAIDATWDLQFSFNLETASGALGNAGAEFDGQYFYTTRWASNLIHRYNLDGTLAEEFSIGGVTGLRDLAFDGTFMYGGAASTTIYIMDFTNKLLVGTITSPVAVRHIAYDEGLDAFWVGNWDTDIVLVDRNGNQLASIPATSHGLGGMYGSAYDSYSAGGPYLWVFDQGGGAGTPQLIHQFDLSTGLATGATHDVVTDIPGTQGIGGGLWIGEGFVAGKASIGGVLQGTPDMFFVYELAETAAPWLKLFDTHGVVAPGDNQDINLRIFGNNTRADSMYVVITTNDPVQPLINVLVEREVVSGIGGEGLMPTSFDVAQNYPNPFNPTTTIKYQLPQASNVKLVIYNVLGQKIRTLVNGKVEAGYHQVVWDGRNDAGTKMASGLYIYRFEAGDFQKVQKMLMLK